MEDIKSILDKYFGYYVITTSSDLLLDDEYYSINDKIFIKSSFFAKTIFLKGIKWGEYLYKDIFGKLPEKSDVIQGINIDYGYVIDVNFEDELVKSAIIIKSEDKVGAEEKKEKKAKTLSGVFTVRILKRNIPINEIEKYGSGTTFLIEDGEDIDVEILKNNEVVAVGKLTLKNGEYLLKINEVFDDK